MSDVDNKVKMIVEGLLLAAGRPLTLDNIIQVFSDDEKPDRKELKAVMDSIAEECNDRGFELVEVASGFRFQVKQDLSEWVAKLWEERPPRYTRALLETLALVAYRQPITRGDIEEIRGVAVSSNIIRTLMDREWVRVVGHRDVPGRPAMFATTKQFLDYFNLKSLQDLPPLSEIKDLEKINRQSDLEDDDLQDSRVLELPEEVIDENSLENIGTDEEQLLAEEEAIALSKKPLDEILNLGGDDSDAGEGEDDDLPQEVDEDEAFLSEIDAFLDTAESMSRNPGRLQAADLHAALDADSDSEIEPDNDSNSDDADIGNDEADLDAADEEAIDEELNEEDLNEQESYDDEFSDADEADSEELDSVPLDFIVDDDTDDAERK